MLTNYDAQAIAEVMGIAFLPAARGDATPATSGGRFVITVDHDPMRIVEAGPGETPDRPGAAEGAEPVRVRPPLAVLIEKAVEIGLPRRALRHVAEQIAGDDRTKIAALEWGIVPKTTLERRTAQLSPEESERTERVARLFVQARRALGTAGEAREFMTAPHPELDGRSPIEAARTDLGTRRTERILTALEYGLAL